MISAEASRTPQSISGFEGGEVDHEAVFHIAFQHSLVSLVDVREAPAHDQLLVWAVEQQGHILRAALAGGGLAYLPRDRVTEHLRRGELQCVLEDFCPSFPGYHLYFSVRRQSSPAFRLLVDGLRYRA